MSQGCTLVLLLAMMVALAVGLMAWGPISLQPDDHLYADLSAWAGIPNAFNVLSCLPLVGTGLWGLVAVWRSDWPASMRMPWLGFFGLVAVHSMAAGVYHLWPGDGSHAVAHVLAAGAFVMLLLGFLAERVDARYGGLQSLAIGAALAVLAGIWWFGGEWSIGRGDMRALVFLETVPVLLIPAGAQRLKGRFTSSGDWLAMLYLYVAARGAGLADAAIFQTTGWLGGHTLMHLLLAALAARLAYRAGTVPGAVLGFAGRMAEPTQRNTSLNTSS
jgi:hypothetical protein